MNNTGLRARLIRVVAVGLLFSSFSLAHAQTYNLSTGPYPPCNTNWSISGDGHVYTCSGNGRVTLPTGSQLISNTAITIVANNGFSLNNNVVGSSSHPINLESTYGDIDAEGPSTINGNITGGSSKVELSDVWVAGSITTGGVIILSGGSVGGRVTSISRTINATDTDLLGGATTQSGPMSITGGTVSGDLIMNTHGLHLEGVTMTEGDIRTPNGVTMIDSTLGEPGGSPVAITVTGTAYITMQNSTVYGYLYYPHYANVTGDENSAVRGDCYKDENLDEDPPSVCEGDAGGHVTVAYYQLSHQTPALTCEAEAITVTAFDVNDQPIDLPRGTELSFSMFPDSGSWTIDAGMPATLYLRNTTPGTFTLSVSDGAATGQSTIEFTNAALKFYGQDPTVSLDGIPNLVAGQTHIGALRAVLTDTDTGACEAAVVGIRTVGMAFECHNPQSCVSGQVFSVGGSPAAPNGHQVDSSPSLSVQTWPVTLSFDTNGVAQLPLHYTDVGQMRLHAKLTLELPDSGSALLPGSSAEFVVKPHSLSISTDFSSHEEENDVVVAAGESFAVRIAARNAAGNVTPSFGRETPAAKVKAVIAELLPPVVGGDKGMLANAAEFSLVEPGVFENDELSWHQVGRSVLEPSLADGDDEGDGDYLGAGGIPPGPNPITLRAYPYEFRLTEKSAGEDSCGNFRYMIEDSVDESNQPALEFGYTVKAYGLYTGVLTNYDEKILDYPVALPIYVAESLGQEDWNGELKSRWSVVSSGVWSEGELEVSNGTLQVLRDRDENDGSFVFDGPFRQFQPGVQVVDADGATLNDDDLNMNAEHSGGCDNTDSSVPNCNAASLGDSADIRYGRLLLKGGHGPETAKLPATLATQYWDDTVSAWVNNSDDACTVMSASDVYQNDVSLLVNEEVSIGSNVTYGDFIIDAGQLTFSKGEALRYFEPPGLGNMGGFPLKVNLSNRPWLQFDWSGEGALDEELRTEIIFGSYRGHDRIIYWREIFD